MQDVDLIRMINQIAVFFDSYPSGQAVTETANHLKKFWDPRMRRQICDYVRANGADLSPTARAAVDRLLNVYQS